MVQEPERRCRDDRGRHGGQGFGRKSDGRFRSVVFRLPGRQVSGREGDQQGLRNRQPRLGRLQVRRSRRQEISRREGAREAHYPKRSARLVGEGVPRTVFTDFREDDQRLHVHRCALGHGWIRCGNGQARLCLRAHRGLDGEERKEDRPFPTLLLRTASASEEHVLRPVGLGTRQGHRHQDVFSIPERNRVLRAFALPADRRTLDLARHVHFRWDKFPALHGCTQSRTSARLLRKHRGARLEEGRPETDEEDCDGRLPARDALECL